jgi:hypothetical protein
MIALILTYKDEAQYLVMGLLVLLAWRHGAGPERAIAAALAFMYLADPPYHWLIGEAKFDRIDLGHLVIDSVTAAALFGIALRANRMYPLWLAAWQLISLISHIIRDISPAVAQNAYAIMIIAPSYFETAIFATGLWRHMRRVRKHGPYRSWLGSSNPSPGIAPPKWPAG